MWFRLRLDIGLGDLLRAVTLGLTRRDREAEERGVLEAWHGPRPAGVFLSVRSALDLLLEALALPAGSEVLMSALTIPDMVELVRAHGLQPVPLDLDPLTGRVDPGSLASAIGPRTRVLLVAQLFGDLAPLDELRDAIGERDVLLVEDCAQSFGGPAGYAGSPLADACLFSFGTIKTTTALGGAVAGVRDGSLFERMKELEGRRPVQSTLNFLRRVGAAAGLRLATGPRVYPLLCGLARALGVDFEGSLVRSSRGFVGDGWLERTRLRPCCALLAFMRLRLGNFDRVALERRRANGRELSRRLSQAVVSPGAEENHEFWLFPVHTADPAHLRDALRAAGFDSSAGHSLAVVPACDERGNEGARELLEGLVFLPAYAAVPEAELERLAQVVGREGGASVGTSGCAM